jgi:hypothetical protein
VGPIPAESTSNDILIFMQQPDLTNQEKLEEVYAMTMENNEILRSIRRQQNIGYFFKIFYWIVILASLGGAYYYVKPIVNAFTGSGSASETIKQFNQLRSQLPEAKLIDQFFHKNETVSQPVTTE